MPEMQESQDADMSHMKVCELLAELNKRDSVCSYAYSRDKGTIAAWYRPVSHCMNFTREVAEEQLQFLRWLKDEKEIGDVNSDSLLGRIMASIERNSGCVDALARQQISSNVG